MSKEIDDFQSQTIETRNVKTENHSDDEIIVESQETRLPNINHNFGTAPIASTYKGKIEVTSKGRRKIFDGVRWQILCRRPGFLNEKKILDSNQTRISFLSFLKIFQECRKQTNKKSLCITHYKEEYEHPDGNSKSWPEKVSSFEIFSYHHQQSNAEDSNETDPDSRTEINSSTIHEGQIKFTHNGRRFILKNRKWQPLCKYDNICRSMAQYELLCIKHFQITQQGRRSTSTDNEHRSTENFTRKKKSFFFEENLRSTSEFRFQTSSPSIIEQYRVSTNARNSPTNENGELNFSAKRSKPTGFEFLISTSEQSSPENPASNSNNAEHNEQSVQTDITIPVCCQIYRENHALYSFCIYDKSKSSIESFPAKEEPRCFPKKFSSSTHNQF